MHLGKSLCWLSPAWLHASGASQGMVVLYFTVKHTLKLGLMCQPYKLLATGLAVPVDNKYI